MITDIPDENSRMGISCSGVLTNVIDRTKIDERMNLIFSEAPFPASMVNV
jgi:hypothetical protein